MGIEEFSEKMAIMIIREGNLDEEKKAVLTYGVYSIIQPIMSLILILIFGMLFHVWIEAIIISVAASVLRKNSGGAHASSAERCLIIGVFIFVLLACLSKFTLIKIPAVIISFILAISILTSYTIIVKYSPVDSASKPIKESDREKFRKKSIKTLNLLIFIAVIFFLSSFYAIVEILKWPLGKREIDNSKGLAKYIYGEASEDFWVHPYFLPKESIINIEGKGSWAVWAGFIVALFLLALSLWELFLS